VATGTAAIEGNHLTQTKDRFQGAFNSENAPGSLTAGVHVLSLYQPLRVFIRKGDICAFTGVD
jgi:hypothetical protein